LVAVVELPAGADEEPLVVIAAGLGAGIRPLGSYRLASQEPPAVVLAYGRRTPDTISEGVRLLGVAHRRLRSGLAAFQPATSRTAAGAINPAARPRNATTT
jgi:DNA-binding transcriptional MocR family regulator